MRNALAAALACALFLSPVVAMAQSHVDKSGTVIPGVAPIYSYAALASSQMALAVSGTAVSLTPATGATMTQICVETAAVRYRDDGTAPTASLGIPVAAGTCFQYSGPLSAVQFIAQSSAATIDVAYYKAN